MKTEVTMKVMDANENELDMKMSSEDIYMDLLVLEFMEGDGNLRGQFEISREEFVSAVEHFRKGD